MLHLLHRTAEGRTHINCTIITTQIFEENGGLTDVRIVSPYDSIAPAR